MSTGDMGVRISAQAELDWISNREREAVEKAAAQAAR